MSKPAPAEGFAGEACVRYAPRVRAVARGLFVRVPPGVIECEDLVGAGMVGLLQAAGAYDPARNDDFWGFARGRVLGAMLDELRAMDPLGRSARRTVRRLQKALEEIARETGAPADLRAAAERVGKPPERCAVLLATEGGPASLDAEGAEALHLSAARIAAPQPDAEAEADRRRMIEALTEEISRLPVKWAQVLSLYYAEGLTMRQAGEVLGLSESRVSQILSQARETLRGRLLAGRGGDARKAGAE